jgi:hypothetical protein
LDYHSVFTICHNIFLSLFSITAGAQTILLFAFSFLLIISFLVSGSQVAFFSLSSKELNVLKTHKQPSFRRIVNLLEKPKNLYASLVITGTTVNIGIVLVCNVLFDSWLAGLSLQFWAIFLIKLAAVSLLLALFAEILPKVWATHHKIWFAATASLVIEVFASIFSRLSRRMVRFSDRIERNFSPAASTIDDNRIDNAIDLLPETEVTQDEKRILKGIRKFGEIHVKQIMRTRMDVCGLDTSLSFSQLLDQVRDLRYSRIPVYHGNLDDIKGMLHTKDLIPYLDREAAFDWQFLIRKPFFVHEQKFIEDLLQDFRNRQIHFAIVVDEFGGTSGIVTLEDIMEEIIGDIKDEFDDEESVNKKIDDFNYVFEGKTMIHEACKAMDLPVDTFDGVRGESDSLAGLVLEIAGEFPQVNEQVSSGDFTFIPLALTRNRIEKIKVVIKPSKMA